MQGGRARGWVESRNIVIEARDVAGRAELFPEAAAELVRLGVDVIVVWTDSGVTAAKKATGTTPIVGISIGDPVRTGLASSLARPGGNVTGVANLRTALTGKWLELLREIVPGISRVAILMNPAIHLETDDYVREVGVATRSWKAEVKFFNARSPQELPVEQPTQFELVINLKTAKALGLTIPPSVLARADQIIEWPDLRNWTPAAAASAPRSPPAGRCAR
jgi:putative ABC transport system substrate-binding protein